ncbi:putative defensin-like protein 27 [Raphanus sativus]|uniref:Defensin-like protein 27 n=1 Tax=Raphanus sativus TaxID=3726 RepID=A0A6J0LDN5_RAPSA|nr:putative defensin-like protein 27 [Raphanus sativus]
MANSRSFFFAFIALSVLLAVVSEDSVWSSNKGGSLCCNDHPKFGVCTDNRHCNSWCLKGCDNKKGGFCKRRICHCYC